MKDKKVFLINILPFFIPLSLSIIIWWNPNFFVSNTFYNIGDTVFYLKPEKYLKLSSNIWSFYNELGYSIYWPSDLPSAIILYYFYLLKIPVWILNRFWLVIPTAMVGWCTYYLFRSLFSKERYAFISGIIASIFVMLPPNHLGIPLWYISLSGFILILAALYRGLHNFNFRYCVLIALGVLLMLPNPRYLYLGIFTCPFFLLFELILNRNLFRKKAIYFLLVSFVFAILGNLFLIVPFVMSYLKGSGVLSNLYSSSESTGLDYHLNILLDYQIWAHPLYIIRLITKNPGWPIVSFFDLHFIAPLTYLMPIYAFSSLFFYRKIKKILPIICITSIFILFGTTVYFNWFSRIYLYLWHHFPGFSILNFPSPWLSFLGVFYAVLTGAVTLGLMNYIDNSKFFKKYFFTQVSKIALIFILLTLICFVYGWGILIGYGPKESSWGNIMYGNHLPAAEIPREYFELGEYLSKEENTQNLYKVLNLPWTAYPAYNWYHKYTMPEVTYLLSMIPIAGISYHPEGIFSNILDLLEKGDMNTGLDLLKGLGFKFVLVHKDYYSIPGVFTAEDYKNYLNYLENNLLLEKVKDNNYFVLFEIKKGVYPLIYACEKNQTSKTAKSISLKYREISPLKYKIELPYADPIKIVFTQRYNPLWKCYANGTEIKEHTATDLGLNMWSINKAKDSKIVVFFKPQLWFQIGVIISGLFWFIIISIGLTTFTKKVFNKFIFYNSKTKINPAPSSKTP